MNRLPFLAILLLAFALGLSCQKKSEVKPVDFVSQIKPILEARCINCHHQGAIFGDLILENRAMAMKSRQKGPIITPGEPLKSQLYIVLTLPDPDKKAMPPTGHRIPNDDVELVKRWIEEGAKWPDGAEGTIKPSATAQPNNA